MYLANDVIQNSKKKGPEYNESFKNTLARAFKNISQHCNDEKTFGSLDRILKIWDERGVYDSEKIKEFTSALKSNPKSLKPASESSSSKSKHDKHKKEEAPSRKRKTEESASTSSSTANGSEKKKSKSATPSKVKSQVVEVNGTVETHVTLSPKVCESVPPEPEELIKMLVELEESASSDASTREKITRLPPEVSDLDNLRKLEDKDEALKLATKVNDAVQLLKDYNARLASEMTDRNKLTVMLKDFQREQQELLAQAEQRLEVSSYLIVLPHCAKLNSVVVFRKTRQSSRKSKTFSWKLRIIYQIFRT